MERGSATKDPRLASVILALVLMLGVGAAPGGACDFVNGDFAAGNTGWFNASEGPGLPAGVQEVEDVDGRPAVLHLDSRSGGNYYLWWTQVIEVSDCEVTNLELRWDWKLAEIESNYGKAEIRIDFLDATGVRLGIYSVRRHTGQFAAYQCPTYVAEICDDPDPVAAGCDQATGVSFDWAAMALQLDDGFFAGLECDPLDPSAIKYLRICIESYNNAGSGVDAYFDEFVLIEEATPVAPCSWGHVKALYK